MRRGPPGSTSTDTPFPSAKLFRSIVSVVTLRGVTGSVGLARRGLAAESVAPLLEAAFRPRPVTAVALLVNSPGGSPAQSELIAARIRDLAAEHDKPVFAFVEDVAASGGYWLACAADEIRVAPTPIVGSIGVVRDRKSTRLHSSHSCASRM